MTDCCMVTEIKKGHMRIAYEVADDGILLFFCAAEEYGEPGTEKNDKTPPVPLVGLKLWGTEHARILAKGLVEMADDVDERRQNERS